jgi:predicted ester cyclase
LTADASALRHTHAGDVMAALPGGEMAVGLDAIQAFWRGMTEALAATGIQIEHLVANERPGRATAVAARWRVQARHAGDGRYGRATGRAVEVLGISHADLEAGRIVREWHLIDDVAIWMQLLDPRS